MKSINDFLESFRFRIFMMVLIIGIVPGIILRAGIIYTYDRQAMVGIEDDITGQAKLLATQIVANNYLEENSSSEILDMQMEQLAGIYNGRIILIDKAFHIVNDTYRSDVGKTVLSEDVVNAFKGETVSKTEKSQAQATVALPISKEGGEDIECVLLFISSINGINENVEKLSQLTFFILAIMTIAVLIIGFVLSEKMVKPFNKIAESLHKVKNGYADDFTPVDTYTETRDISGACNDMLGKLQVLDSSRQEFVSNVSHELKTPLTSMKVLADSLIGQENVPVELYQEFMYDIGQEIDRENKIINDLLSLVKLDKTSDDIEIVQVNINDLLELILKRLRPIAKQNNIELILESYRPVMAEVDEVKLTLALSNLVENAVKYNNQGGWVHVTVNADHQNFFVTVEDNGMGIPEEALDHIFERFYRADKSHSREIGGTGLGLAIARSAIILHHGEIKVHSELGEGTQFMVRIPLNYIP